MLIFVASPPAIESRMCTMRQYPHGWKKKGKKGKKGKRKRKRRRRRRRWVRRRKKRYPNKLSNTQELINVGMGCNKIVKRGFKFVYCLCKFNMCNDQEKWRKFQFAILGNFSLLNQHHYRPHVCLCPCVYQSAFPGRNFLTV